MRQLYSLLESVLLLASAVLAVCLLLGVVSKQQLLDSGKKLALYIGLAYVAWIVLTSYIVPAIEMVVVATARTITHLLPVLLVVLVVGVVAALVARANRS